MYCDKKRGAVNVPNAKCVRAPCWIYIYVGVIVCVDLWRESVSITRGLCLEIVEGKLWNCVWCLCLSLSLSSLSLSLSVCVCVYVYSSLSISERLRLCVNMLDHATTHSARSSHHTRLLLGFLALLLLFYVFSRRHSLLRGQSEWEKLHGPPLSLF